MIPDPTAEPKPCPFCGHRSIVTETISNTGGCLKFDWCTLCRAEGPRYNSNDVGRFVKWNRRACAGIPDPEAALAKAREALAALLRETNNIEVLGEWSGLDINHGLQKKARAKVDSVIQQAREALAAITPKL